MKVNFLSQENDMIYIVIKSICAYVDIFSQLRMKKFHIFQASEESCNVSYLITSFLFHRTGYVNDVTFDWPTGSNFISKF